MAYDNNVRNRYVSDGAGVVPPARLVILLYDRLAMDLEKADVAIVNHDIPTANDKLTHAQSIILELHSALDMNGWNGAESLAQLYIWLNNQLQTANVKKDVKIVRTCLKFIKELQGAWTQAYDQMLAAPTPAAASVGPTNTAG